MLRVKIKNVKVGGVLLKKRINAPKRIIRTAAKNRFQRG